MPGYGGLALERGVVRFICVGPEFVGDMMAEGWGIGAKRLVEFFEEEAHCEGVEGCAICYGVSSACCYTCGTRVCSVHDHDGGRCLFNIHDRCSK